MEEPKPLDSLFKEKIFRIPDACYHKHVFDARRITEGVSLSKDIVLYHGDCLELLRAILDGPRTPVVKLLPSTGKECEKKLKSET
jgi:hypothetical protein